VTKSSCDIEIRVRYAETDQMGVVHHSQYAVYFEMGRTELLRQNGISYRDMEQAGVFLVVARLEMRLLAPARYDDVLRLHTRTVRLTRARVDHQYQLYHGANDQLLAEASTTLACVGRDGKLMAIPEDFWKYLAAEAPSGKAS